MAVRRNTTYSNRSTHASRAAHARGDRQFRSYDTSYIQPHRKKSNKGPAVIAVIIAIVVIVAAGFGIMTAMKGCSSGSLEKGTEVQFTVNAGEGGGTVAENLVKTGLIGNANDFKSALTAKGAEQSIKPGTYTLVGGMTNDEIISKLVAGPEADGLQLVVPEGYTVKNIATAIDTLTGGTISSDTFLAAANNVDAYRASYAFIGNATSLEGFLFPKTYSILSTDTADSVIRKMLDQYQAEVGTLDFSYATSAGLTNYEALILASIVEKESDASTRNSVAAVFYNRLTTDGDPSYGYLQSDATTAYEVGHDPTAEEVHADTPYSTYTNKGLPPTPICNPGLDAIKAVCNPDMNGISEGYYFFYFTPDSSGKMQYFFSKTLDEHNAVIAANS